MANLNLAVVIAGKDAGASSMLTSIQAKVQGLSKMGVAAGVALGGLALAAGGAVAGGLAAAARSAVDFEARLSGIKAVSGATQQEMAGLSRLALDLGKQTAYSASQAAGGIEELIKAGVSVPDIMSGAAEATLNLAAAGGVELTEAAIIASAALNQFGLSGKAMAGVSDLIAGAANASALDVHQFGESLQMSGAIAAQIGFKFGDLATAIALMGRAGIAGSDAGTSLKTMMMRLSPQTDKAAEEMQRLGIITKDGKNQFFDAAGRVRSMADVSEVLSKALAGLSEEQRINALNTLFGSDAIRAGTVLAKAGAKGYQEMAEAMGKVTAAQVAAVRMDNLRGALEQLKGALETASIVVGMAFLPMLTRLTRGAAEAVNAFTPVLEVLGPRLARALEAGLAGLGAALSVFAPQLTVLQNLWLTFVGALSGGWGGQTSSQLDTLTKAVGVAGLTIRGLYEAVRALLTGEGGVAFLTQTALPALQHAFPGVGGAIADFISQGLADFARFIMAIQRGLGGDVRGAVTDLLTLFVESRIRLVEMIAGWVAALTDNAPALTEQFQVLGQSVLAQIGTELEGWRAALVEWATGMAPIIQARLLLWRDAFLAWIAPVGARMQAEAGSIGTALLSWVASMADQLRNGLVVWAQSIADWVPGAATELLANAQRMGADFLAWVLQMAPIVASQFLNDWAPGAVIWVLQAATDLVPVLGNYSLGIMSWITANAPSILERFIGDWVPAFLQWMLTVNVQIIAKLVEFQAGVLAWIVQNGPGIAHSFVNEWVPAALRWAIELNAKILPHLLTFLGTVVSWITTKGAPAAGQAALAIGDGIVRGIARGLANMAGWLYDQARNLAQGAIDAAKRQLGISSPSVVAEIEIGRPFVEGIALGIERGAATLEDTLTELFGGLVEQSRDAMKAIADEWKAFDRLVPGGGRGGGGGGSGSGGSGSGGGGNRNPTGLTGIAAAALQAVGGDVWARGQAGNAFSAAGWAFDPTKASNFFWWGKNQGQGNRRAKGHSPLHRVLQWTFRDMERNRWSFEQAFQHSMGMLQDKFRSAGWDWSTSGFSQMTGSPAPIGSPTPIYAPAPVEPVDKAPLIINISVAGSVVSERNLIDAVYNGLLEKRRHVGALGLA